ncbi:MAG TPA: MT-A70 family methyltransferase [Xanthobacteraceae bacterium]|nr:MT-A70 family methyltransferase [Xanthobacteraceae bacterium]
MIYADPPWAFSSGPSRNPRNHYPTMKVAAIAALPVAAIANASGSRLLMWTTIPFLEHSFTVIRAWGFRYVSARVWIKTQKGHVGRYFAIEDLFRGTGYENIGNAEILLVAKRGRPAPARGRKPFGVIVSPRREHSRKPDEVRAEIARCFAGPRIELFARSRSPGWDAWGNETGKFKEAA